MRTSSRASSSTSLRNLDGAEQREVPRGMWREAGCFPRTARRGPLAERADSRPAGLEPATPGLEGRRKETTRGSGTPLPRVFIGVPANARQLETTRNCYALSPICHPAIVLASNNASESLQPRHPITRTPMRVRDRDDQDAIGFHTIDDVERKPAKQVPTGVVVVGRPRFRKASDRRFRGVQLVAEFDGRSGAALRIPSRRSLALVDSFLEVLKIAGHVRPPRGCVDAPRPRKPSWHRPSRRDQVVPESRQTMPPRRLRRSRDRGSGLTRPRARRAPRPRVGAPLLATASHPYRKSSTSARRISNEGSRV